MALIKSLRTAIKLQVVPFQEAL